MITVILMMKVMIIKIKIKQGITKIIKVLLMCMVTKTIIIKSIILITTIMIILVITISNNSNL